MRYLLFVIYYLLFNSANASFLTAQKFPTTFADVPFAERMAIVADGYEPFETIYDENGNCISGCAFTGMNIEDSAEYYGRQTDAANARAEILRAQHPEWVAPVQPEKKIVSQSQLPLTINHQPLTVLKYPQSVPTSYPMDGAVYITSSYGRRTPIKNDNGTFSTTCHRGVDFYAMIGTPIYSTIAGTVVFSGWDSKGCGNTIKIRGADGFSVGFCHLSKILAQLGDSVGVKQQIGLSGNTGNSGGPHLHYIVYDEKNAQICPEKFFPAKLNTSNKPACGQAC